MDRDITETNDIKKNSSLVIQKQNQIIRHKGIWYQINPKQYESESQTMKVAWLLINQTENAYVKYYEERRMENKILYPDFRKV